MVVGELERPRVVGQEQRRRASEQCRHVAVEAGAVREVLRREEVVPGPGVEEQADAIGLVERMVQVHRHERVVHVGERHAPQQHAQVVGVLADVGEVGVALGLRRRERADAGHLRGEVERKRAVGGDRVDLLGDGEVAAMEEQ